MALKDIQQQVEESIQTGVSSLESFHKQLAESIFAELQKIEPIASPVAEFKEMHDKLISSCYDLLRSVNQQGGEIARSVIDKIET